MSKFMLGWRSNGSHRWYPVGFFEFCGSAVSFYYLQGVLAAQSEGFSPLLSFPNISEYYRSEQWFEWLKNRLFSSRQRSDYKSLITWLRIEDEADSLNYLARSNGIRATDEFELVHIPDSFEGTRTELEFFPRGIERMPRIKEVLTSSVENEQLLYLMSDAQNTQDEAALLMRTKNYECVGYVPRYFSEILGGKMQEHCTTVVCHVKDCRPEFPLKYALMCVLSFQGSSSDLLAAPMFQPLHPRK